MGSVQLCLGGKKKGGLGPQTGFVHMKHTCLYCTLTKNITSPTAAAENFPGKVTTHYLSRAS